MDFSDILQPQKIFYSHLTSGLCIRPNQIYGEYKEIIDFQVDSVNASLYFIVEIDRIQFIPAKTSVSKDGTIKLALNIGGKRFCEAKITFPQIMLSNNLPPDFKSMVFGVRDVNDYFSLLKKRKYKPCTGISLDSDTTDEQIVLNVFAPTFTSKLPLLPFRVVQEAGINIGINPKILYIGQSRQIKKRANSHEKIQRALAEVNRDKDIYIYFFDFNSKVWLVDLPVEEYEALDADNPSKVDDKGRLNLVEMALINYFKPRYNSILTRSNVTSNKQVEKLMKAHHYTQLIVEVSFDSEFFSFGSDEISNKKDHLIIYQLDNPFLNMEY
ncbi:MAG: hypothetical protein QY306_00350 [Anaerolineales bacterium]|nr:MAG: hypothetical protein QY306_00350 [Anaerolineales bacterium]